MVQISDTTLRDGAQAEGISFPLDYKLQMVQEIDELGVSWIEAGNPQRIRWMLISSTQYQAFAQFVIPS